MSSFDFRWQVAIATPEDACVALSAPRPMAPIVVPSSSACTGASRGGNARTCVDVVEPGARARPTRIPRSSGNSESTTCQRPPAAFEHVVEGGGVADLLDGEHVGRDVGDPGAERGHLRAVGALVVGPVPAAGPEQVLEVPRREEHSDANRS